MARARIPHAVPFNDVCSILGETLRGPFRRDVVAEVSDAKSLGQALTKLREGMRTDIWRLGSTPLDLARAVRAFDGATRQEGFHALHDWDGVADHVNADTIPVDVLNFLVEQRGKDVADPVVPAILLDYYFMHILGLLTLRVWDEGDPDANLDRVHALLELLQGPGGSGQRFVDDGATLLLVATSHYELHDRGYQTLLDRVRTLGRRHRAAIALGHATSMGCHLRFGFEATYARDTSLMRNDNVADYPWLCFALATVMDEYDRARSEQADTAAIAEALLNGLSADARAFLGEAPSSIVPHELERGRFRELFLAHRAELTSRFETLRPVEASYAPVSFFFNFAHNVLKGAVVDALIWGEPWRVSFNDLLTAAHRDEPVERSRLVLARTLMAYARTHPQRIRGRMMPVIVYDPEAGFRAFRLTLRRLAE